LIKKEPNPPKQTQPFPSKRSIVYFGSVRKNKITEKTNDEHYTHEYEAISEARSITW
jgi:hypothetical protein